MTRYDDAIVGAGVLGLAHAYHLARRGRRVVVCERHPRAMSASVRNFGMLWPIGQPAGTLRELALASLSHWKKVLIDAGLWHDPCGSLHLAYHEDEAAVLREFVDGEPGLQLLSPAQVKAKSPFVQIDGLRAGVFSATEICVDPRQVIAELPAWLSRTFGVTFHFNERVLGCGTSSLQTYHQSLMADRVWVCSGEELQSLYPAIMGAWGLKRCKLQMLRSAPLAGGTRIGPMLAGGLTLRHYKSFAHCPSLALVRERVTRESPWFDDYGIHVMASQNGRGEVVIGDSHEYGLDAAEPFDRDDIDRLILDYLATFLNVPDMRIAERWHGIYMKHPQVTYLVVQPEPGVTLINGVGGNGMTLSFGLAEQTVSKILGERST